MAAIAQPDPKDFFYHPYGAAQQLFKCRDTEVILTGPANTGKSRACLEKVNMICEKYPGVRTIMIRRTRRSLTQSGMVTFSEKVLYRPSYAPFNSTDQEYRYPNGSVLAVAGVDDPRKIYSSEWDIAYVQQAEELDLEQYEPLLRAIRNHKMPYQQIIGDCNPDVPHHWIKARASEGKLTLLETQHEDNPTLWDRKAQCWTERGVTDIANLDALSGVRKQRLRFGIWAAAEGTVYEESWNRALHVIDRKPLPREWPRYWGIDFGYTNPFVWLCFAEDPDGRLICEHQIYKTKTIVEDHCATIKRVTKGEPKPRAIICDHDAEDRATFERHMEMQTTAAFKSVSPGIQAVETRLRKAGDGRPRLLYMRDSLVDVDKDLQGAHKPICVEDEYEAYVWDTSQGRKRGEEPVKANDHGQDNTRYVICHVDSVGRKKQQNFAVPAGILENAESLERPSPWRLR